MKQFKAFGKKFEGDLDGAWSFHARPGGWWIAEREIRPGVFERRRFAFSEVQGKFWGNLRGKSFYGESIERRSSSQSQKDDSDLVAQFPGKVLKVLVKKGADVEEGESLVLVEAMKMEFAVKAPFSGRVRELLVQEGAQLSPGDRFLDLEARAS